MLIYDELSNSVIEGDLDGINDLIKKALDEGIEPEEILYKGLMKGMEIVGKRFAAEEMYIPEVMLSARTMQTALDIIRPLLEKQDKKLGRKYKMVLGTVEGDIHDIGKSLVAMMFTANDFEVIDIGINVPPDDFVDAIQKYQPEIVGLSALLTTTMPAMARTVEAIDKAGLRRGGLKIIVGGAPISEEFANEIKADLYGENAIEGVDVVKKALDIK